MQVIAEILSAKSRVEAPFTRRSPHRTVLALLTHTAPQSRIHQDYFPLGYLYRFRFHSIITSVCVECFPGKGTALSSPSLSRHYPVFLRYYAMIRIPNL